MTPYYEHGGVQIFHGDCREIVPTLDFNVVVCDPPYGRAVNLARRVDKTIEGDEDVSLRDWIIQQGVPKLIFGSPFVPRPVCGAVLVWDKSELTGMGNLGFPWKATHEEIYVIGEGFKSKRRRGSVLRYPLRPAWSGHQDAVSGLHPTEKPIPLMVDLLECCPWKTVLDPTCGIGSTLVAAKKLGKDAIGIELDEKYCEIAANRLSQQTLEFASEPELTTSNLYEETA